MSSKLIYCRTTDSGRSTSIIEPKPRRARARDFDAVRERLAQLRGAAIACGWPAKGSMRDGNTRFSFEWSNLYADQGTTLREVGDFERRLIKHPRVNHLDHALGFTEVHNALILPEPVDRENPTGDRDNLLSEYLKRLGR